MTEQVQKSKSVQRREEAMEEIQPEKAETSVKDELDDLLDEIDSVLEENAEEFIRNYVQKGESNDSHSRGEYGILVS